MADMQRPAEIAEAIAEGVRSLNYATRPNTGQLEYPADLAQVLGELRTAVDRMPQALGQMRMWLTDEHVAGRVAHDEGRDTREYVIAVTEALERASDDAITLAAALYSAHESASHLKAAE